MPERITIGMVISICIKGTFLTDGVEPEDYYELDDCVAIRRNGYSFPRFDIYLLDDDFNVWEARHTPRDAEAAQACSMDLEAGHSPVGRWKDEGGVPVSIDNAWLEMHADEVKRCLFRTH